MGDMSQVLPQLLVLAAIVATLGQTGATLAQVKTLSSQNTGFALDLYKKVATASMNNNVFLSAVSISTVLAMVYAGAKGNTDTQMGKVMRFKDQNVHKVFDEFLGILNASATDHKLILANAMFGKKGYKFVDKFRNDMTSIYKAGLQELDYSKTEEARKVINQWIEDRTNGKIRNMIPKGALNAATALVLVNAIYFKGTWDQLFEVGDTVSEDFFIEKSKTIKVPTMKMTKYLKYAALTDLDAEVLELPYKGKKASMFFILPNRTDGLGALESGLTASKLSEAIDKVTRQQVVVSLPKFTFTQSVNLKKILYDLGITDLFDASKANLRGISPDKNLYVSEVLHKTFIKLDEYGTEAAASTVVTFPTSGFERVDFTANRPFLFAIRDTATESILFLGRVTKPTTAPTTAFSVGQFGQGGPVGGASIQQSSALACCLVILITLSKLF